jgi:hypothetical protein
LERGRELSLHRSTIVSFIDSGNYFRRKKPMVKLDPQNAQLLLQIYDLRREEKLRRAREWMLGNFWAETLDEFNALCPPGTQENAYYRQATTYWETVALIVNKGMLDEDLYFESTNESLFTWMRVKKVVLEMRTQRKNPLILRNLETLSEKHEKWLNARAPELIQEMQKIFQASRKKAVEKKK